MLVKCRTCENCGANLDFGERCDCEREVREQSQAPQQIEKKSEGLTNGRS